MAAQRVAGTAYVKVDGQQYPLRGNLTISPAATSRTGVAGMDRVHGYSEAPLVPFIEGDFTLTADWTVDVVTGITSATIQAELANGRVYVLQSAWQAGEIDLNAKDGIAKIRFEGLSCIELT